MKKLLKILGYSLGIIVIVLAIFATYIHFKGIPTYAQPQIPEVKVEVTPAKVEQGQKIASMLCMHCHTGQDNMMSGRKIDDLPSVFGEIYSMNITQDKEKGIGNWSDGEIIYFLRTGLRKNGVYSPPYMPKFPLLSEDDVQSIVAWLRSGEHGVLPSQEEPPASKPSFLVKMLAQKAFTPLPFPEKAISNPDTTDALAWGKYLTNNLYACFACHSADFKTNDDLNPPNSVGFYGGGNILLDLKGNEIKSKNITPDDETGIGSWTEADFITALTSGKTKNGKQLGYPMMPYTRLTNGELKAMYAYLRTIPAIKNKVE